MPAYILDSITRGAANSGSNQNKLLGAHSLSYIILMSTSSSMSSVNTAAEVYEHKQGSMAGVLQRQVGELTRRVGPSC